MSIILLNKDNYNEYHINTFDITDQSFSYGNSDIKLSINSSDIIPEFDLRNGRNTFKSNFYLYYNNEDISKNNMLYDLNGIFTIEMINYDHIYNSVNIDYELSVDYYKILNKNDYNSLFKKILRHKKLNKILEKYG